MAGAMEGYMKAKYSAERDMYVRYAEREGDISQIRVLLDLPYDSCAELYKLMLAECNSWAEITPYSFDSIWQPARERYRSMMFAGVWNFEDWKKEVSDIVHRYHFKQLVSDWQKFEWETIEEIEWDQK